LSVESVSTSYLFTVESSSDFTPYLSGGSGKNKITVEMTKERKTLIY